MTEWEKLWAGYPAWEYLRDPADDKWLAVAIELRCTVAKSAAGDQLEAWVNGLTSARSNYLLLASERERLRLELADQSDPCVRLVLIVKRSAVLHGFPNGPRHWTLDFLSIGAPFALTDAIPAGAETRSDTPTEETGTEAPAMGPIIGIIDDGIAFLNARFCQGPQGQLTTRFISVWLQAELFPRNVVQNAAAATPIPFGKILRTAAINLLLANGRTDAENYRDFNARLYPAPSQQATNTSTAHGTHVLDLAAGEPPETGGGPLIAVQLAPGMATDTSGRRLEAFLVMGLRWIVLQAIASKRDLVVNISLGSLAGPGDEHNFIANSIKYELGFFARAAAKAGRQMRVVVAYGNSFRSNLVASVDVSAGKPVEVDWRIQPDDYSSSLLELRTPLGRPDLKVEITPPDGKAVLAFTSGTDFEHRPGGCIGNEIAAVLPLPDEEDAKAFLVAVAPTASLQPGGPSLAAAGAWRIRFTVAPGAKAAEFTLRVQRNDTPVGYRVYGRQSYLADRGLGGWDDVTHDYTAPENGASSIRRDGTANAYAGLPDIFQGIPGPGPVLQALPLTLPPQNVFYVGAVRPDPKAECSFIPSLYSSSGLAIISPQSLQIKSLGPTLSARADDGRFLEGRQGSSVHSGRRSLRLSGTSAAAGIVTRYVALDLAFPGRGIKQPGQNGAPAGRDARVGYEVIEELVTDCPDLGA